MSEADLAVERAGGSGRLYFLDNLRAFIILLVVVYHCGFVYEASGIGDSWWIVDDPATNNAVGIVNLLLDIFMMPTLFFVSGYLAPMSVDRKGAGRFVASRARRLMIPWAVAMVTLVPLYKVIFLYSRGWPQQSWTSYFHFSNGGFSQSWLWFLPVLFLFDMIYAGLRKLNVPLRRVPVRWAIAAGFVVSFAVSITLSLLEKRGWTKTPVLDFQNEKLAAYLTAFVIGAICSRHEVFGSKPTSKTLYTVVNSTSWLAMNAYVWFVLIPFMTGGRPIVTREVDKVIIWLSLYVSVAMMVYTFVETFRRYFNRQGRFWRLVSRNCYSVYIIHVIVMGVFAVMLLETPLPSVVKFLILTVATYAACNVIASLYGLAVGKLKGRA